MDLIDGQKQMKIEVEYEINILGWQKNHPFWFRIFV
jgi:hypothetical protein